MRPLVSIYLLILYFHPSWSGLGARKDEHLVNIIKDDGGLCDDVMANEDNNINKTHLHPLCHNMTPRGGHFKAESTESSPWKIYTYKQEIQQFITHPVVLGSDDGKHKFINYMITAKTVDGRHIIGHFEYQWDATPICCYVPGQDYTREGPHRNPVSISIQVISVPKLCNYTLSINYYFCERIYWLEHKEYAFKLRIKQFCGQPQDIMKVPFFSSMFAKKI